MTLGMGIFLASLVWASVAVWRGRRVASGSSLWEKFRKFLRLVQRALGFTFAWGTAICLLLFFIYVFKDMLTSWLVGGSSPSQLINWDLRETAFFILAIIFICGAYAVPVMILEGDNKIADISDKLLFRVSRQKINQRWRINEEYEETRVVSVSKKVLFLSVFFALGLTPRIAEFFMSIWELHLVPFYMNNQSLAGGVLVILWIGGILLGIAQTLRSK